MKAILAPFFCFTNSTHRSGPLLVYVFQFFPMSDIPVCPYLPSRWSCCSLAWQLIFFPFKQRSLAIFLVSSFNSILDVKVWTSVGENNLQWILFGLGHIMSLKKIEFEFFLVTDFLLLMNCTQLFVIISLTDRKHLYLWLSNIISLYCSPLIYLTPLHARTLSAFPPTCFTIKKVLLWPPLISISCYYFSRGF